MLVPMSMTSEDLARRLAEADVACKTLATLEVEVREPGSLRRDETKSRRIIEDGL